MPKILDRERIKRHLENFDLRSLFIEVLGWDHGGTNTEARVGGHTYILEAIAHKRGMVAYLCVADSDISFPKYPIRRKIENAVAKEVREHIIVYATHDRSEQTWQWVKREPGRPDQQRSESYRHGDTGERLTQKLQQIVFTLEEEEGLTLVDVSGRVRAAFDVEKVTKKFYDRFKKEHHAFLKFIEGIGNVADREWYASLMLNRMMFIYFIQKRDFLDGDPNYLRNRLEMVRQQQGDGNFHSFYRLFLLRLFHEGLGQPKARRAPELAALLGKVPYLNGGLFDVHDLERDNLEIQIPDEAFGQIFNFFDAYQWHLDDRPLRKDNEINPDVLGYIFEKYINQKQMGAYYTKEDITGYISRNTVIPFLFDLAKKYCSIAFKPGGGVWRLLSEEPDKYFYEAVRHGITYDIHTDEELGEKRNLPPKIAAGLDDVSKRGGWNEPAPSQYALKTETWREHVARRQRYEEVHANLVAGKVTSVNDLITYNLDIEKFAQDVIANSEGPELVHAFYKAITQVSILDPTCGSGAFLFAALNILEPIYTTCLESMHAFLDDLDRSKRRHSPLKLSHFRKVLKQIKEHAGERYFILKSIIVNNLYGVDIMEEAVEICKLRLFLKLVAQLDSYDQIEPLPDIDFNVRAGNTLVGFTTLKEIQDAFVGTPDGQRRMLYAEDTAELKRIEEDAEIAARAFNEFREMQTVQGMNAEKYTSAKLDLRRRLDNLREELNQCLAGEYDVRPHNQTEFEEWCESHQPFHWFVEFYGIMQEGGFDVIIGNPPYVQYKKVHRNYTVKNYLTEKCGDLYAFVMERCAALQNTQAIFGMIVPVSIASAIKMQSLRNIFANRHTYHSHFADRPSSLFLGVHQIVSIVISRRADVKPLLISSGFHHWRRVERNNLFSLVNYSMSEVSVDDSWHKIGESIEDSIFLKIAENKNPITYFLAERQGEIVSVCSGTGGYYLRALNEEVPSREYRRYFSPKMHSTGLCAVLNSNLFYWFWRKTSNSRHLNLKELRKFKIDITTNLLTRLNREGVRYIQALKSTQERRKGKLSYVQFRPSLVKEKCDQIDQVLAEHYGFTEEELDFIINYDIKYRMGL